MTLPTRAKQIAWMADSLSKGAAEGEDLEQFAARVVDTFHDMIGRELTPGYPPLHVGMAFKSPFTTKAHFVGWQDGERVWIISDSCNFGWFGRLDSPYWQYIREYPDGRRAKKAADGSEIPLGPRPGSPGHNPDWKVGDLVSRGQRAYAGHVVATGDKCVLLESAYDGNIQPESNENMSKYYRREN